MDKASAVTFVGIEEQHSTSKNLICRFVLNHYTPQEGDRIVMFKLGWKSIKEYVLFEWVPIGLPDNDELYVIFHKHELPESAYEMYQICYISGENALHGATIPFQFNLESSLKISTNLSMSKSIMQTIDHVEESRSSSNSVFKTLEKLQLCDFQETNVHIVEKDLMVFNEYVDSMQKQISQQQNEINHIKTLLNHVLEKVDKAKLAKHATSMKISKTVMDNTFDLGELESLPPFPLIFNFNK